jgi:hypothetical protein
MKENNQETKYPACQALDQYHVPAEGHVRVQVVRAVDLAKQRHIRNNLSMWGKEDTRLNVGEWEKEEVCKGRKRHARKGNGMRGNGEACREREGEERTVE